MIKDSNVKSKSSITKQKNKTQINIKKRKPNDKNSKYDSDIHYQAYHSTFLEILAKAVRKNIRGLEGWAKIIENNYILYKLLFEDNELLYHENIRFIQKTLRTKNILLA